jgi:peptidoglycan/LPS O-acetylase OafA/YrhL
LYLWQQLFLFYWHVADTAIARFPLNLVCSFGAAAVSYYAVEKPILAWRDRAKLAQRAALPSGGAAL